MSHSWGTRLRRRVRGQVYRFLRVLLTRLPGPIRYRVLQGLAWLGWFMVRKSRLLALAQLALALPDYDQKSRAKIARASLVSGAQAIVDFLLLAQLKPALQGAEHLDSLPKEQGFILASLHQGCWEAVPLAIQQQGRKVLVVTNIPPDTSPLLACYQQAGIEVINRDADNLLLRLLAALKEGVGVCLFCDQRGKDIELDFFGHVVGAPAGVAQLCRLTKAPLLLGYSWYDRKRTIQVGLETIEVPQSMNWPADGVVVMQRIYHRFEALITEHPEQWQWIYRRWPKPLLAEAQVVST